MEKTHRFEQAGLGKAPFQYIGFEEKTFQAIPGGPVKAGGSCQYCSTGIRDCFWVRSADGREFYVGCECIKRVGDRGLQAAIKTDVNRVKRERKAAKDTAKIQAGLDALDAKKAALEAAKHPAISGKTMFDYVNWMFQNAGTSGKIRAANIVLKA